MDKRFLNTSPATFATRPLATTPDIDGIGKCAFGPEFGVQSPLRQRYA